MRLIHPPETDEEGERPIEPRDEFHITCEADGWAIEVGGEKVGTPRPTRSMAVWTAENLAREEAGSRIVVHATDGSIVVDYPTPSERIDLPWSWTPA